MDVFMIVAKSECRSGMTILFIYTLQSLRGFGKADKMHGIVKEKKNNNNNSRVSQSRGKIQKGGRNAWKPGMNVIDQNMQTWH